MKKGIFSLLVILSLAISIVYAQESLTISTYYPSPYGSYKELQLSPNDLPSICSSNSEGTMYYDLSEHAPKVCVNDGTGIYGWAAFTTDTPEIWLGTDTYLGYTIPADSRDRKNLTNQSITGPKGSAVGTSGIRVDISAYPKGFYEIEWAYNIDVDARTGKGVTAFLQSKSPGGSWNDLDSIFLEDDDDLFNSVSTNQAGNRVLNVAYGSRSYMQYRIQVRKNGGAAAVSGVVQAGQFIKISRM